MESLSTQTTPNGSNDNLPQAQRIVSLMASLEYLKTNTSLWEQRLTTAPPVMLSIIRADGSPLLVMQKRIEKG